MRKTKRSAEEQIFRRPHLGIYSQFGPLESGGSLTLYYV